MRQFKQNKICIEMAILAVLRFDGSFQYFYTHIFCVPKVIQCNSQSNLIVFFGKGSI